MVARLARSSPTWVTGAAPRTSRSHPRLLLAEVVARTCGADRELASMHAHHWPAASHASWTTYARPAMHAGWHPRETRAWATTHVVGMPHGVTALGPIGKGSPAHILAPTVRTHSHLRLAVTHGSLVSLLGHVQGWVGVRRRSALTAKHSPVRVHWHPHVDAGTASSYGHVVHSLGAHAWAHHLGPTRYHALLHHLHSAHALHVLGSHPLHPHAALHLHLAPVVAHPPKLAHAPHLAIAVALHRLHVPLHPRHPSHTLKLNMVRMSPYARRKRSPDDTCIPLFMLIIPRMPGFIMFGFTIPFIWLIKVMITLLIFVSLL